ncbi:hypothetical protein M404DRAFT_1007356 [Pisolithus tinctorius Marx 270]|uniref:Uncharacterized protein n=1 Tax=Pisolithus tinctorius Marx 270 TaxID=870435 RepID=A0A0C3IEV5_PISTI|nr:hypothetical protein M404DRAFT_1007356 [Pisolithus tinctorius Marx 270]
MHRPTGTEAYHNSANKQTKEAIKFFSDIFGLEYLRNFTGEISFFKRLASIAETDLFSEVSVGTMEDGLLASPLKSSWAMTRNPFRRSWKSNGARDPRLRAILPLLQRRCRTLHARDEAPRLYGDEKQKMEHELKSISQTLSAGLHEHISITFSNAYLEDEHSASRSKLVDRTSHINYDRQLDIHSKVQEIKELKAKLDATGDEDEQRALEEDITGRARTASTCYSF